jgi:hypothetical protein
MGILDELHIKVEEIEAEQLKRDLELEAQEEFYREHLRPVMIQAHQYLSDIVENLNIVTPKIEPSYPLRYLRDQLVSLDQTDYQIDFDSRTSPHQIDVTCNCTLAQPQEFYVPTKEAALRHSNLLNSYDFPHHRKNRLDKRYEIRGATFILEGPMPVHIRLLANAADRCVNLLLYNIEDKPVKKYKFSPEKFTPELLERLARLLVREESMLVSGVVSQDYRERLQQQLEEENRRKKKELSKALADLESQKSKENNARPMIRAKRAVMARAIKASKLFEQFRAQCISSIVELFGRIYRK